MRQARAPRVWFRALACLMAVLLLLTGCQAAGTVAPPASGATTATAAPGPPPAGTSPSPVATLPPTTIAVPPAGAPAAPGSSQQPGLVPSATLGPTLTPPLSPTSSPTAGARGGPVGSPTAAAPAADWPTYHRDLARTGDDPTLTTFAQARVAWRSGTLDGDVYAEPLVVGGQAVIATQNNTVYAFDLATGRPTWRTHLGEPISRSQLPCGNISLTGITSTPVADAARRLVYVVAFVQPGRHDLVALDLTTGAVRFRTAIDPPGADPFTHQQRAALTLSQGQVYVAFGGLFGDCGVYHGWVVAADSATGSLRSSYQVPTEREGGIWAPGGPSVDSAGDLFVATGNGSSTDSSRFDGGDAVLHLSPDVRLLDWFAPRDWAALNRADADVGSVSPALLGGGLIFQIGKAGVGYLLRAGQLGHVGGQIAEAQVCSGGFGATAYRAPFVYVPCVDGLVAVRVSDASFSTAWRASGFFAGPPIVAGGAVWTIARDGTLLAFDPVSGASRVRSNVGGVSHFATPSASGPYLLIPTARELVVERLEQSAG